MSYLSCQGGLKRRMRKDLAVHTAMEVGKELDGSVIRASKHKLSLSEMAYQAAVCVELTVVALVSGKLLPEWPLSIATAATGGIPDLPLQLLSPPPWTSLLTDSPTRCSCLLDLSLSPHPSASACVSVFAGWLNHQTCSTETNTICLV